AGKQAGLVVLTEGDRHIGQGGVLGVRHGIPYGLVSRPSSRVCSLLVAARCAPGYPLQGEGSQARQGDWEMAKNTQLVPPKTITCEGRACQSNRPAYPLILSICVG